MPLRTRTASVGQFLMQVVQPRQRLYSRMTECFIINPHPLVEIETGALWARPSRRQPLLISIRMVTVVPTPTVVSMRISSEYRFMLGRPIPAPNPRSRATSPAVE